MENWTREELKAAVLAYKDIQERIRMKEKVVKSELYRALSNKYKRKQKAYEYRMQNISYVLSLSGREWIQGLKPAKHVGTNVIHKIEDILAEIERRNVNPYVNQRAKVISIIKSKSKAKPQGNKNPKKTSTQTSSFNRDDKVSAWVLEAANGKCELCGKKAPFVDAGGLPYLEVHHVRHLADQGSDTVTNAVALCPNCHREMHYGLSSHQKKNQLYKRLARLIIE